MTYDIKNSFLFQFRNVDIFRNYGKGADMHSLVHLKEDKKVKIFIFLSQRTIGDHFLIALKVIQKYKKLRNSNVILKFLLI